MTELKPCPFCGQTPPEDSHYTNQGTKWGGVLCCIEGPEVRTNYKPWPHFKERAIEAWNHRAYETELLAVLYPNGIKHPQQAEWSWMLDAVRALKTKGE